MSAISIWKEKSICVLLHCQHAAVMLTFRIKTSTRPYTYSSAGLNCARPWEISQQLRFNPTVVPRSNEHANLPNGRASFQFNLIVIQSKLRSIYPTVTPVCYSAR